MRRSLGKSTGHLFSQRADRHDRQIGIHGRQGLANGRTGTSASGLVTMTMSRRNSEPSVVWLYSAWASGRKKNGPTRLDRDRACKYRASLATPTISNSRLGARLAAEVFADRIFVAEKLARERLVDDGDVSRRCRVLRRRCRVLEDRGADRRRSSPASLDSRRTSCRLSARGQDARLPRRRIPNPPSGGEYRAERHRRDAGNAGDRIVDALVKRRQLPWPVARQPRIHRRHEALDPVRIRNADSRDSAAQPSAVPPPTAAPARAPPEARRVSSLRSEPPARW